MHKVLWPPININILLNRPTLRRMRLSSSPLIKIPIHQPLTIPPNFHPNRKNNIKVKTANNSIPNIGKPVHVKVSLRSLHTQHCDKPVRDLVLKVCCTQHWQNPRIKELTDKNHIRDIHHLPRLRRTPHLLNDPDHHNSDHIVQHDDQVLDGVVVVQTAEIIFGPWLAERSIVHRCVDTCVGVHPGQLGIGS
jgi:hypothetical protein